MRVAAAAGVNDKLPTKSIPGLIVQVKLTKIKKKNSPASTRTPGQIHLGLILSKSSSNQVFPFEAGGRGGEWSRGEEKIPFVASDFRITNSYENLTARTLKINYFNAAKKSVPHKS